MEARQAMRVPPIEMLRDAPPREGFFEEHQYEAVYRRYAIVSDADLQEAARKLAGTIPGTAAGGGVDSASVTARHS